MSEPPFSPPRPQTPVPKIHRIPEIPTNTSHPSSEQQQQQQSSSASPASQFAIVILGPKFQSGRLQIATTVAKSLNCPFVNGDAFHESCAAAASAGSHTQQTNSEEDGGGGGATNSSVYSRMWLSKMMRTGFLFPEDSRPANEGLKSSSSSSYKPTTSPKYTTPTVTSPTPAPTTSQNNPALLLLTSPPLDSTYRSLIRTTLSSYSILTIFVPLYVEELDPRKATSFGKPFGMAAEEDVVMIDTEAGVEAIIGQVVGGVEGRMREVRGSG